ncbi:MAG: translation initiation factor IF-2 [Desulfovibrio sp.]|nr:translation initiation factor IF-2 [Desulfovibrio sp.]
MKKPILSTIGTFISRHLRSLALLSLFAVLATGAYYGWAYYQYRQSALFAFTGLQQALIPPNAEELAVRVDFNTLSEELATAAGRAFPFFKKGDDQTHAIKHIIQTHLLRAVLSKDTAQGKKNENAAEKLEERLKQTLQVLPADVLPQLADSLALKPIDDHTALVSATIHHPVLDEKFVPVMRMVRMPDGWILRDMVNAEDLVQQFRAALLKRHTARHELMTGRHDALLRRMEATLPLQSCTAGAGLLSDNSTVLVVVHALARNISKLTVKNISLDVKITAGGQPLLRRFLNAACDIPPGSDLNHRWTIELDGQSEAARALLAAGPLHCQGSWRTMSLSSAEVLHVEDMEHDLPPCDQAGHDHPRAFCLKPIFKN